MPLSEIKAAHRFIRNFSEEIMHNYNRIAGTVHDMPSIIPYGEDADFGNDFANFRLKNQLGMYVQEIKTVFVNMESSFDVMRKTISHELVHYSRDMNLGKRALKHISIRNVDGFMAISEGCANFAGGVQLSRNADTPHFLIHDIYRTYFGGAWWFVASHIPNVYEKVSNITGSKSHTTLFKIRSRRANMNDLAEVTAAFRNEYALLDIEKKYRNAFSPSHVYEVGTNLSSIIYVSTGFNLRDTMKKLLVLPEQELTAELKKAIRPEVSRAIAQVDYSISKMKARV